MDGVDGMDRGVLARARDTELPIKLDSKQIAALPRAADSLPRGIS